MEASIVVPRCLLVNCPDLPLDSVRAGPQMLPVHASSAQDAVARVCAVPFRLILVQLPLSGMSTGDFIGSVRSHPASKNKNAALIAIATAGEKVTEAGERLTGVNELLFSPVSRDRLAAIIDRFASIAPRKDLRMMVKLRPELKPQDKQFFAQAHDVSQSGMLVAIDRPLEIGTPLEAVFTLPGDSRVIKASIALVRGAMERRITGHAYGAQFTYIDDGDKLRLADFCNA